MPTPQWERGAPARFILRRVLTCLSCMCARTVRQKIAKMQIFAENAAIGALQGKPGRRPKRCSAPAAAEGFDMLISFAWLAGRNSIADQHEIPRFASVAKQSCHHRQHFASAVVSMWLRHLIERLTCRARMSLVMRIPTSFQDMRPD